MAISIEIFLFIAVIAFILELLDASVGMGYGTLAPILLFFGFPVHELVSAVLLTSFVLSLLAAMLHHHYDNVDFGFDEREFRIALLLGGFGILGVLVSVFLAVTLPEIILKSYIGALVAALGIIILINFKSRFSFSWLKVSILGVVASFNKGIAGGGYGPVLATGQIMSGIKSRHAVPITAFSESIVSVVGLPLTFSSRVLPVLTGF